MSVYILICRSVFSYQKIYVHSTVVSHSCINKIDDCSFIRVDAILHDGIKVHLKLPYMGINVESSHGIIIFINILKALFAGALSPNHF